MMAKKVLPSDQVLWALDGSHYLYRAYFAISELTSPTGIPVNAIFGFLRMMQFLIEKHGMRHMFVAWDDPAPSWRKKQFPAYKAHREEMPERLVEQIPHLREILNLMGVPQYTCPGYEADDIMASCVGGHVPFDQIVLVTNDKDLYQLIDPPNVIGFHPQLKVFVDTAFVQKRYGVLPTQMRDYLTLVGDSSDGVPGVPGVGPKTASDWLTTYENLKNVLAHVSELRVRSAIKTYLEEHVDRLEEGYTLIGLKQVPDIFGPKMKREMFDVLKPWDVGLWDKFQDLGFRAISEDFRRLQKVSISGSPVVSSSGSVMTVLALEDQSLVLQTPDAKSEKFENTAELINRVKHQALVIGVYDFKRMLHQHPELVAIAPYIEDGMLLDYLRDPDAFEYSEDAWQKPERWNPVWDAMRSQAVYTDIEKPLIRVLFEMERYGIEIDRKAIQSLRASWLTRLERKAEDIYAMAGLRFNLLSSKQLGEVLYTKCGLPILKHGKTGPSTDAQTLMELRGQHPIVTPILEYRELAKLVNTYTDSLLAHADNNDVLHTEFLQYGAATGRLSSRNPNLQNIPRRSEEAASLRNCFTPRNGMTFVSFDYSQIELRILAHMSAAKALQETFRKDEDVHLHTAEELFGKAEVQTHSKLRDLAKTINFGILYGQTAFGLSKVAGISQADAKLYIEKYYAQYPEVKAFQDTVIARLSKEGQVETLYGRVRKFPPESLDPKSRIYRHTLRAAFNMALQGSGADLIKLAMLATWEPVHQEGGKLVMQVHDELIFEFPKNAIQRLSALVQKKMEHVATLSVPLKVNISEGSF